MRPSIFWYHARVHKGLECGLTRPRDASEPWRTLAMDLTAAWTNLRAHRPSTCLAAHSASGPDKPWLNKMKCCSSVLGRAVRAVRAVRLQCAKSRVGGTEWVLY